MAVIKGYCDDSASKGIWTVAGYVGKDDQWTRFETIWPRVLKRHDVPYFHTNEMNSPHGVYGKWYPSKDHQHEIIPFFQDLFKVIQSCVLNGFYSTVKVNDLNRFNKDYNMSLEPLPLAIHTVLLQIGKTYPNQWVEAVFDKAEDIDSKIATAKKYARSDKRHIEVISKIITIPWAEEEGFKDVLELQAADFAAWELRKEPLESRGRASFRELMWRSANQGGIWDYKTLCRVHEARNRIWSM